MEAAPLRNDLARGPAGGSAWWIRTQDGLRLRIALWPAEAARGTVLLLPGRTEYIEKYGLVARDLTARGLSVLVVDWRGQGLSTHLHADPARGHILGFPDFQHDLEALLAAAAELALPKPWVGLAHSMAGAILLRRIGGPHPFAAVAFSAPMWGIALPPWLRAVSLPLARALDRTALAESYLPGSGPAPYVLRTAFRDNQLTGDAAMWAYLIEQAAGEPAFALGGPSVNWIAESLIECSALAAQPSPALPCIAGLGGQEKIIDAAAVRERMARWPGGRLLDYPQARHEVMMEDPATRTAFLDAVEGLFVRA